MRVRLLWLAQKNSIPAILPVDAACTVFAEDNPMRSIDDFGERSATKASSFPASGPTKTAAVSPKMASQILESVIGD
jgi:hypothetical protein